PGPARAGARTRGIRGTWPAVLLHPVDGVRGRLGFSDARPDEWQRLLEGLRGDVARPLNPLEFLRALHEPGLHDRLGDVDEPAGFGYELLQPLEGGVRQLRRVDANLPVALQRRLHPGRRLVAGLEHMEGQAALLRRLFL